MAFSRYKADTRIAIDNQFGVAKGVSSVRRAIKRGTLPIVREIIMSGDDRLDTIAGSIYGDSSYWWVLAAASDIGWGMQVPPGTVIKIVNLREVESLVS